ncbi:MAG: hypothetical protein ACOYLE_12260, partial [Bacteroidales bacterium]
VLLFSIATITFAGSVTITKRNGKKNEDKTVTYKYTYFHIGNGNTTITCTDPGDDKCAANSVLPGAGGCTNPDPNPLGNIDICAIEQIVMNRIANGEANGEGTSNDGAKYSYSEGSINNEVASYVLIITVD